VDPPPQSSSRGSGAAMLKAAGRRFGLLLAGVSGITAVGAGLLGVLAGSSLLRAISLGFYLVGSFLVIAGFFVGNRGPVRAREDRGGFSLWPARRRWATAEEHATTINDSAIFVTLGFVLIVLGVVADTRYDLF
jgi:hypothetical protein